MRNGRHELSRVYYRGGSGGEETGRSGVNGTALDKECIMSAKIDDFSLEKLVKGRSWTFGHAGTGDVFAHGLVLASGGRLQGYSHPNENSWRVKGGAVEFLNQNAAVSARFEAVESGDGRHVMEGRFRMGGPEHIHYLREEAPLNLPQHRTALVVPIHDAYFGYGINLLYQSIGSDYDIVFVFSTDADRRAFGEMHQGSLFLSYSSIVLDDYLTGSALAAVAERKVWPTVKKFLAISLIHSHYDYILCVDAETFVLRPGGWTQAAERIVSSARWYGGALGNAHTAERQIMHASSAMLAPAADQNDIRNISQNWSIYTWWWDLPVYSAASVPGFLEWIGWDNSLQFIERLGHNIFDHITYQFYMSLHGGFTLEKVNSVTHSLEFSNAGTVSRVHREIAPVRWTNAFAYAQAPGFFIENDYLAIYHIDRKSFPQFNIE